jgi:hypothetical protein
MKVRNLLFVFSILLGLGLASVSMADGHRGPSPRNFCTGVRDIEAFASAQPFVGLWQGIDSFDGSTQFLSITCNCDGVCDVRLNDTAFTLSCENQIGFAQGEGSITGNVLTVDLTLSCSNLDGTSTPGGTQTNEFVLDRKNRTLTNINDDPGVYKVFHRISQ